MVYVLIHVELLVFGSIAFFVMLGLVSYGARLEQKYKNLQDDYEDLKKKKEK